MDKGINFVSHRILKNESDDTRLASDGYAIFPILDDEVVKELTHHYFEIQKENPQHFYSSTHSTDFTFRKNTSDYLKSMIAPLLPVHFKDYQLLGGAYVVKPPHGKGILPPHQDWNIVDETKGRSYNLWIPLTDVTIENGAVFVLNGSHRRMNTYRGPGIPSMFKDIEKSVWNSLRPLPMKAGEALFYDHALLHASPVNQTDKIRLGIVCGVIPTNAEMQLYFNLHNKIAVHAANESFFLEKDPMKGPDGLPFLRNVVPEFNFINETQYKSIFLEEKPSAKKGWLAKLVSGD